MEMLLFFKNKNRQTGLLMSLKEEWSRKLFSNRTTNIVVLFTFFCRRKQKPTKKKPYWCECGDIKQISKQKDQVSKHRFGTRIVSTISHKVPYQSIGYQHLLWYGYHVANILSYQSKYPFPEALVLGAFLIWTASSPSFETPTIVPPPQALRNQ